ncbi:hypothetical protein DFJ58DRAFT_815193 [Suillus subalutaceus]|uniref:uncharacterized protein n=1 Tax=Suillus subalutaceus TaxID=48586 RepID=UPI001B8677A3|nr:uncharacterized protein DFJ58DRAFT_815193 [Suillus subalutaceus]KAG1837800.1 hypothetical protein DFJ58DRAFT_815193 [Suillus subalutaceus]
MCFLNFLIILRLAFQNKATRQPGKPKDFRGVPLGFFDDAQDRDHSSTARNTHRHSSRAPSSSLRSPRALLDRVMSLFRQSHSHTDEAIELQRRPRQSIFSRRGPHVVEVATVQDRKPLAVAPQNRKQQQNQTHGQGSSSQHQAAATATSTTPAPGTTTTGAPTVRSRLLTLLARLVLFLCCAYPPCSNG